jgi:hypothetical protein
MKIQSNEIEIVSIDSLIPHPKNCHNHPDEQWRETECKGYYVSSLGRLYSIKRKRIKTPTSDKHGYLTYAIYANKKNKTTLAHRLVAKYFLDDYSQDLQVNHIDFNRTNNNVANLQMLTLEENIKHSAKNGRYVKKGMSNSNCKYDDIKVLTIKTCVGFFSDTFISKELDIPRNYVNSVKLGKIRGN